MAQACHVAFVFSKQHRDLANDWMDNSEYICILEIDNELELANLWEKAQQENIPSSRFIEPDFNNSLTAIALAPGPQSKKLCSKLPLALK